MVVPTSLVAGALSKIQELQKEVDTKEQTIEDFQRVLHEQQRSLEFCSNEITIIRDRLIRWGQENARNIAEPESFATNHCCGKRKSRDEEHESSELQTQAKETTTTQNSNKRLKVQNSPTEKRQLNISESNGGNESNTLPAAEENDFQEMLVNFRIEVAKTNRLLHVGNDSEGVPKSVHKKEQPHAHIMSIQNVLGRCRIKIQELEREKTNLYLKIKRNGSMIGANTKLRSEIESLQADNTKLRSEIEYQKEENTKIRSERDFNYNGWSGCHNAAQEMEKNMLILKERFAAEKTNYRKHAKDKDKEIAFLTKTNDKLKNRLATEEKHAKAKDFEIASMKAAQDRQNLFLASRLDVQREKHRKWAEEKNIELASLKAEQKIEVRQIRESLEQKSKTKLQKHEVALSSLKKKCAANMKRMETDLLRYKGTADVQQKCINSALECEICFEQYNGGALPNSMTEDRRPVVMPGECGRSVCISCAEKDRAARAKELTGNAKMIECMFCRYRYHSEHHTFPINRGLMALL